jgi:hypothetical protein
MMLISAFVMVFVPVCFAVKLGWDLRASYDEQHKEQA